MRTTMEATILRTYIFHNSEITWNLKKSCRRQIKMERNSHKIISNAHDTNKDWSESVYIGL